MNLIRWILAILVIVIISMGFLSFLFADGDVYLVSGPNNNSELKNEIPILTVQDFNDHPALEELVINHKNVLISHGLLTDTILWLNPFLAAHSAGSKNSKFSGNRISFEEARNITDNYHDFKFNNTRYFLAMTQCGC
jgi:hypothetical protein